MSGEREGSVLRIEKISPNDGNGLRTVVFLKGCPLRCKWCSTPESQKREPQLYYQQTKCHLCGKCVSFCPEQALSMDRQEERIRRDQSKCTQCMKCVAVCNAGAHKIYGKKMTVKDVMRIIHRDEIFYYHSNGGVTLSGGDVLCQSEFAKEILEACKESGIHTMAELDMYGAYEHVERILPYLDEFFVDLKVMDPQLHKKWTGRENHSILENVRKAAENCKKDAIHIRVPLIWGMNDDRKNIEATADFCSRLKNCRELEFLPYHRLGIASYQYLGRPYELESLPAMTKEEACAKVDFLTSQDYPFEIRVSGKKLNKRTDFL